MKKINSLLLILLFSITTAFSQVNLRNGLVACYPFNANVNDATGNGNDGTVNGATLTTDRFGNANSAYNFDGASSIIINVFQFKNQSFSYSAWVQLDNLPLESENNCFIAIGAPGGDQLLSVSKSYQAQSSNGFNVGAYNIGTPVISNNWDNSTPIAGKWYHLVFTRDNFSVKLYVDGLLIVNNSTLTETGATSPNYASGSSVTFGGRHGGTSQFLQGSLDDIYIYNRAITAEEVTALYQSTKSPSPVNLKNGLVACYPFNANANDESGNGNNGTVNGATLTTDRFGKVNSAYNFNGSSLISVNPSQFKNQSYTYATWVKLDNLPSEGDQYSFISIGGTGGDQVLSLTSSYQALSANGFNCAAYNLGTPSVSSNWTGTQPNKNSWYHVVYTRDNTSIKLYVNGILISNNSPNISTNATNPNYATPTYVTIGARGTGFQFTQGSLDDIHLYNRPLTAEEVKALYDGNTNQSMAISTSNLSLCGGNKTIFTVTGTSNTAKYQWKIDGVAMGTNSKTLLYTAPVSTVDYQVKVSVEVMEDELCFPNNLSVVEKVINITSCNLCVDGVMACIPFEVKKTR